MPGISAQDVTQIARDCGFELAGITSALPAQDYLRYEQWAATGMAGEMAYLTDHRGALRADPRRLLPTARSVLCVGKLYNAPYPYSTGVSGDELAWISRYAWGDDYHDVLRLGLEAVVERLKNEARKPFESRICVDSAPILERSYARLAGLGWVGRNTCLINQQHGSWFFLGELLLSLDLAPDVPAPDRCGTCRRCIDACPTQALVPQPDGTWSLDARLCISYLTIERRGSLAVEEHQTLGRHVFGCDICQDVCPWNRRASATPEPAFQPRAFAPDLARLAALTEDEFRTLFRHTPVWRAKYRGFLRNVAIALGNARRPQFQAPLEKLAAHPDPVISRTAEDALARLHSLEIAAICPVS